MPWSHDGLCPTLRASLDRAYLAHVKRGAAAASAAPPIAQLLLGTGNGLRASARDSCWNESDVRLASPDARERSPSTSQQSSPAPSGAPQRGAAEPDGERGAAGPPHPLLLPRVAAVGRGTVATPLAHTLWLWSRLSQHSSRPVRAGGASLRLPAVREARASRGAEAGAGCTSAVAKPSPGHVTCVRDMSHRTGSRAPGSRCRSSC